MINRRLRGLYGGLVDDQPMPFIKLSLNPDEIAAVIEVDPEALQNEDGTGPKEATMVLLKSGGELFLEKGVDDVLNMFNLGAFNGVKE